MTGDVFGRNNKSDKFFGKNEVTFPNTNNIFGKKRIPSGNQTVEPNSVSIIFSDTQWVFDPIAQNYVIIVENSVHGLGRNSYLNVYELDGSNFVLVTLDQIKIDITGNYIVRCNFPFTGKFIISG